MVVLKPGDVPLAAWRDIYRGADVALDPACHGAIERSAAAVSAILAKGEPIYGINTGFGKLASVRIPASDLAVLQRNIVLSHAAGAGSPMPATVARLMMALKLASLAQGASGVRLETVRLLEALLVKGLTPVVPCQGSVGASGDLAPLAHMSATMIGTGEIIVDGNTMPAAMALADAGLAPLTLGAKEGLALLNGTLAESGDSVVESPIVVEGYWGGGRPADQFLRSRSRAILVRQYLQSRFQLDSGNLGIVPMKNSPPNGMNHTTWDGICIVVLKRESK